MSKLYNKKKVIFISSAGGHLAELLQLDALIRANKSFLITEKTSFNRDLKQDYKTFYLIYGGRKYPIKYFLKSILNLCYIFYLFFRLNPDAIITTGAHSAVGMSILGRIFRRKVIYIETMANINRLSLTGRILYPLVDKFYIQWNSEVLKEKYPKAIYKGNLF